MASRLSGGLALILFFFAKVAAALTPVPWPVSVDCPIFLQKVSGLWELRSSDEGDIAKRTIGLLILSLDGAEMVIDQFLPSGRWTEGRAPLAEGLTWSVRLHTVLSTEESEPAADLMAQFAGHCHDEEFALTMTVDGQTFWLSRFPEVVAD
jgi:hypothetical protein